MAEEGTTRVIHTTMNGKYRIVFEKASGVKTGDGFKVEVNSDDFDDAQNQAAALYEWAKQKTVTMEGKDGQA